MLFNEYDFNGNGSLDKKEFECVMKHVNNDFSIKDIDKLFKKIDTNRNGVIEFDEFL